MHFLRLRFQNLKSLTLRGLESGLVGRLLLYRHLQNTELKLAQLEGGMARNDGQLHCCASVPSVSCRNDSLLLTEWKVDT